jgi:hypothetical protein
MAPTIRPMMHNQRMKIAMPVKVPPLRVLCAGTG